MLVAVVLLAVLVGLVTLTARRPAVAEVDPADLAPGFEAFSRPTAGFAIALPETWTIADLGDERLLDPSGAAATGMPEEMLGQFQALVAPEVPFELLAYGDEGVPGFSIISRSRARTDTLDRVKYSVESALIWTYGIFDPGFQLLDVDGHDTLRFTYSIPTQSGEIHVVQYVVMREESLMTARFHVAAPGADPRPFDAIIATLRTTG